MVIQNILKEKSIYEIQFCIRNIIVITKVRSRQAVKPPAVQPVVRRTPHCGARGEKMNSKRIGAFFIDFIIIALIYDIPFIIFVMLPMLQGNNISNVIMPRTFLCVFFAFILLVFKDVFKNGSLGKKIMKLKIIDSETKENASFGKRILRNITWILSWIEIIVYLASNKRIGDRLAKTDVVSNS